MHPLHILGRGVAAHQRPQKGAVMTAVAVSGIVIIIQRKAERLQRTAVAFSVDGNRINQCAVQLNGDITEVRVWSVARSEQEIWDNMYDVDPKTPGLIGYWKFDEGQGNVIRDWTGNGNDAVAEFDLDWPSGIEVPQINKE